MLRIISLPALTLILGLLFTTNPTASISDTAAYPEELPGAFTGGFGEETCHSCHFDYPLNPDEGSLTVEGIPKQYQPGEHYQITISVERDDLGRAGFQLSSRFTNGSQAGSFKANSDRLSFTEADNNIQYLQHSVKSSRVDSRAVVRWKMEWTAPDSSSGKIIFNLAANAGNGDASSFGDFIFSREFKTEAKNPD